MTSAGLPPIALEAVLKLLAIAEGGAGASKPAASKVASPELRLELSRPDAAFAGHLPGLSSPSARRTVHKPADLRKRGHGRPDQQGEPSC